MKGIWRSLLMGALLALAESANLLLMEKLGSL
jgi:hypothetical protein